jgi:hypothetical protein
MKLMRMTLGAAARALRRNKLRSVLTMLGIIIGVAAVIAMVSIGQGADAAVQEQIRSLGTDMMMIVPGATTASGVRSGWGGVSTLTVGDALAIQRRSTTRICSPNAVVQVVAGEELVDRAGRTVLFRARTWPVVPAPPFSGPRRGRRRPCLPCPPDGGGPAFRVTSGRFHGTDQNVPPGSGCSRRRPGHVTDQDDVISSRSPRRTSARH